jgi:serine protease AprX
VKRFVAPVLVAVLTTFGLAAMADPGPTTPEDTFKLTLGGRTFDPVDEEPSFEGRWGRAATQGPDLQLVQLTGPTQDPWLDTLRARGVEPVQYIHPFTYVVWADSAAVARLAELSFVRWTGPFLPAYRVLPRWRSLSRAEATVDVIIHSGAGLETAVSELGRLSATFTGNRRVGKHWQIATMRLRGDRFIDAAAIPGVYSIQLEPTDGGLRGEMSNQVNVNNVDGTNAAFPGYTTWLSGVGLDGTGVVMANVDGGVQDTHPDLVNRFISCSGTTCSSTSDSHGTHTAGIMAADGSSGTADSNGFLRGQGMAPAANLVEQVYSPHYQNPGGMLLLIQDSFANGAVLSSNSWGPAGSPQGYDNDTLQVDQGVRDADPGTAENQQFSYILSFMNGNGGTSSQGSPDEAKNIFTVGSTKMQNGSGAQILDINDLSSNSAHGPALDGRTIPHIVAPGCQVDSTLPTNGYGLNCGTSMASPHVSGAVGLFFQYYRAVGPGPDPSPALVKAAFLPVAHNLEGFDDADGNTMGHPFDSKQGWGRMNVAAVVDPQVDVAYYDAPHVFDATGEEWSEVITPGQTDQPVRMMLVWTDAPGHGLGGSTPAWNNDLDLVVEYGGETYRGNVFGPDGWSATGGSADGMNNTEGVFLQPPLSGAVTVRVLASNINSDGVPGKGDDTDQDFSLVVYNAQGCVPPTAPQNLTATAPADNQIDLDWDPVGGITGYEVYRSLTMGGPYQWLASSATDSYTDTTVSGGTTYYYVVRSIADCESVDSNEAFDLATGSCTREPSFGGLTGVTNSAIAQCTLELEWDAGTAHCGGPLSYDVYRSTTHGFTPGPESLIAAGESGLGYVDECCLDSGVEYFYVVRATDSGNGVPDTNVVELSGIPTGPGSIGDWSADMEDDTSGWAATGLWHLGVDTACVSPSASSGTHAWYYGQEPACDYDTGATNTGTLTSPVIEGVTSSSVLSFDYWRQVESTGFGEYDSTTVEVSYDGGAWTQVWYRDCNDPSAATWSASGDLPLSPPTEGAEMQIRFTFNTDDSTSNDYTGWLVDDVVVTNVGVFSDCSSAGAIFADGFENGDMLDWSNNIP